MARILTVTAITQDDAADWARRSDVRPCVDERLAWEVRVKIGELRGTPPPEIAIASLGESEWLAYVMEDMPAGDSGIFRISTGESSQAEPG